MWAIKGDAEAMFFLLFCLYYLQILDSFVSRLDEVVGHFAVFCQALFPPQGVPLFWRAY